MATDDYKAIGDMGCIFHVGGDYAPEYKKDYQLGAWMKPPPGTTTTSKRSICDECVERIRRRAQGFWQYYEFDEQTKEVRQRKA